VAYVAAIFSAEGSSTFCLFYAGLLLGLFFDPEEGCGMFILTIS
jgi:hypothetical protein